MPFTSGAQIRARTITDHSGYMKSSLDKANLFTCSIPLCVFSLQKIYRKFAETTKRKSKEEKNVLGNNKFYYATPLHEHASRKVARLSNDEVQLLLNCIL